MKTKEQFISQYLEYRSDDVEQADKLINILSSYITESWFETPLDLERILQVVRTYREENISNSFGKRCEATAPILEMLSAANWGLHEIQILASVIGHTPHHKISKDLMQEAFDVLDDEFYDSEYYEATKLIFYFNLSLRLLRAKYYENIDLQDVNNTFDDCVESALSICETMNFITYRTILLVRKALFYGNCKKITEGLDALETLGDKKWIKATQDEMVEFLYRMGDRLTTPLFNFMVGYQIKRRRKELGVSTIDFADAIGSSPTAVNEFERGDKGVRGTRLCEIAKLLQTDIAYLYGDLSKRPVNTITDIKVHTACNLMSNLSDIDKDFILGFLRDFIKLNNKKNK